MSNTNLSVRLEKQTYEDLTQIIDQIKEENNFKKAGQAYAVLVEMIKNQNSEIEPDFKDQIKTIRANLNMITSSVNSMNEAFLAYKENKKVKTEKEHKGLTEQINNLTKINKELSNQNEGLEERVEELTEEVERLKKENLSLSDQLSKQESLDELVSSVKEMLDKKEE